MKRLCVLVTCVGLSLWISGCSETKPTPTNAKIPDPATTAKQGLEESNEAMGKGAQAVKEGAEEVKDAAEDAADKIDETVDKLEGEDE
ncbi:MAG: hypothetical protein EXS05_09775 [Planctomycetaceae bacterium]|nr:hypothetical protein [Planctomycetaceae bacterium]